MNGTKFSTDNQPETTTRTRRTIDQESEDLEKKLALRAVSIHLFTPEDLSRWHFLEENATRHRGFCKEQNRNRCNRRTQRTEETRQKIMIGGMMSAPAEHDAAAKKRFADLIEKNVTRDPDKIAFAAFLCQPRIAPQTIDIHL